MKEDSALKFAADNDVIEFASMWKASQKCVLPSTELSDTLGKMSRKSNLMGKPCRC
jgi:hypothetical protein